MGTKYLFFVSFALLLVSVINAGKIGTKNNHGLTSVVNPDPNFPMMPDAERESTEPGIFQGDMLGVANKDGTMNRNAMANELGQWPGGKVPYIIASSADTPERKRLIQDAIADYNKYTCIKFVPRTNENNYVKIEAGRRGSGCYAQVGKAQGEQVVNLAENGCWEKGVIIHELMHTLGFYHEHMRSDRDNYITVHFNYIPRAWHTQFRKLSPAEENTMGFPYDLESIMHYGSNAYPGFNHPSMTVRNPTDKGRMGQRAGFSKQDIQEVNRYYKCNGKTSMIKTPCKDATPDYCQSLEKANKSCDDAGVSRWCKKTCGECGDSSGNNGGNGSDGNSGGRTGSGSSGSGGCKDANDDYCRNTIGLPTNKQACEHDNIRSYCKMSCGQC